MLSHDKHEWLKLTEEKHDGHVMALSELLYHASCGVCEEELDWEHQPDGDGGFFYITCCNISYTMWPSTYQISINPIDPEDEEDE